MSARDELAGVIGWAIGNTFGIHDTSPAEDAEIADAILAAGYTKPRTITTAEELDAAIVHAFESGENLVLSNGWRPWIIWENDRGDLRVTSLPVEDDPQVLTLAEIPLPATVMSPHHDR